MKTYKIYWVFHTGLLLSGDIEGMDIVEAESAVEAQKKFLEMKNYNYSILDIIKID